MSTTANTSTNRDTWIAIPPAEWRRRLRKARAVAVAQLAEFGLDLDRCENDVAGLIAYSGAIGALLKPAVAVERDALDKLVAVAQTRGKDLHARRHHDRLHDRGGRSRLHVRVDRRVSHHMADDRSDARTLRAPEGIREEGRGAMKATKPRPLYSQRFLAKYGRGLRRDELRLVQGYRGLSTRQREGLHALVSAMLLENVQAHAKAGAR